MQTNKLKNYLQIKIKWSYLQTICLYISKVSDHSRGWPEGSLFDSYYTKV